MFLTYFIIALACALALLIKDWIETKKLATIETNWKKYVGCLLCGLVYGLLSDWKYFRWLAVVAVIYLAGNSFNNVLNAINWILGEIGSKTKV